ncbi:hypothetical protein A3D05_02205 [Candidatus Gottesmanbacteria bacterium RIFCSPHIGHO2_02_FULL_40_24]|nr:MAG: hypothetical protein A3D05_02205 [Candidatus Gottesmanbacteria bacterium RIFCSPHIGHO2_02_FULL_40_24]OGG22790.1 MAG: hypothetical protein A3B48_05365 [Candidatus Gottesmanbacteria bacterium RIFCSPLOWO2_01_FULL_40_10]OGG22958.1 MAG: hypothetical protein A3E42_06410 [Candidatus Gottesmanbacteria bacterium RIFCSPHIGHO2_12_FULL_40_13]
MINPEAGPPRRNLMEVLKEILKQLLGKKQEEKLRKEEAERKSREKNETARKEKNEQIRQQREKEKKKKEEREAEKAYHERRSAQKRVEEEDLEKAREAIHKKSTEKIKEQIKNVIEQPEPEKGKITSGYETAYYLFPESLRNDPQKLNQLYRLIEENPRAASVLEALTEKDAVIHSDPGRLLEAGKLLYISTPDELKPVAEEIISVINRRIKELIPIKAVELQQRGRQQINEETARQATLNDVLRQVDPYVTPEQRELLANWRTYEQAVDQILSSPGFEGEVRKVDIPAIPGTLPETAIKSIDKVWEKVEQVQKGKRSLTTEELDKIRRELYEAESDAFPKDVIPGSEEYNREVQAIYRHSEERLNQLAEMFRERLRSETPPVKTGITDPEEFLFRMSERSGILGDLLLRNPEMLKLFTGTGKDAYWFRNQIFLRIHGSVLTQKRESSGENFSLYERSDFTSFISLLRGGLSGIIVPDTGKSVGQTWSDWYTSLSTTIRLSRDIDFWVSQPAASIDNFNKSLALFQNEYSVQAMTMPAVEQAYRAYETALMTIRDTNDGYIPPALIEYDAVHNTIYWDQWAQDLLSNKMIPQGVVRDSARDFERMGGLPLVNPDGITTQIGDVITEDDLKKDPQKLEIQMYMTLAKGFGMASMRFLEIVANSKVPMVGMPGFHSPVYEGAAIALNYWNLFMKKWGQGAYKYFHMMNTVLPYEKRLPVDSKGAEKAYLAHLNGTFKEKYGEEAKRLLDVLNFDRASGAFTEFTPWRYFDDTIGWTDRQRQLMGGPTRHIFAERFASEKVKEYLVEERYKEIFRKRKREAGQPDSGPEFDTLWLNEGISIYESAIDKDWRELNHHHKKRVDELIYNYTKAFRSRVWVETAMRSPVTMAHIIDVKMPIPGYGKEKKSRKLHSYIIEQVLGITPEDIEYGSVEGDEGQYKIYAAKYASPTEAQRIKLKEIFDLEGDLMSVREIAMSENRELRVSDFEIIKDTVRQEHARKYWNIVKRYVIGDENPDSNRIYQNLGIELHFDNYDIDWHKIERIDEQMRNYKNIVVLPATAGTEMSVLPQAFEEEWLNKEFEWVESTDDTAFREMDLLNLGSRQWVRRGGDVASHFQGSQLTAEYFDVELTPNPDPSKLAEALLKIRKAYQGDDIGVGYRLAGALGQLTSKLYEFDYKRLGSAAQMEVWNTRRGVAAWNANGRRAFWDAVEHMDVIPPHAEFEFPNPFLQGPPIRDVKYMNIHELRHLNHADNADVWVEILTLGILLATAITVWRAFTAKSEEEEAGGH